MTNSNMTIEGKVFEIVRKSEKVWEVVLRKKSKDKIVPIASDYGHLTDAGSVVLTRKLFKK